MRAIRNRYFARSAGLAVDHPFSNASRAVLTARATSSAPACGISASGSSLEGSIVA
jgi:hypothetical protein